MMEQDRLPALVTITIGAVCATLISAFPVYYGWVAWAESRVITACVKSGGEWLFPELSDAQTEHLVEGEYSIEYNCVKEEGSVR